MLIGQRINISVKRAKFSEAAERILNDVVLVVDVCCGNMFLSLFCLHFVAFLFVVLVFCLLAFLFDFVSGLVFCLLFCLFYIF